MKVELIIPIDKLRGMLRKDGFYFRMYRGQQIVQSTPTKWKGHPGWSQDPQGVVLDGRARRL